MSQPLTKTSENQDTITLHMPFSVGKILMTVLKAGQKVHTPAFTRTEILEQLASVPKDRYNEIIEAMIHHYPGI